MFSKILTRLKSGNKLQFRRRLGILLGLVIAGTLMAVLIHPPNEELHARGPMNIGHEDLSCTDCHKSQVGTFRQQIQAKVRFYLGNRQRDFIIGHQPVDNESCLSCHARPNEVHPVYRFNEPRFAEARKELKPQHCVSCHTEHKGERVTMPNTQFCASCHGETKLKNDPLNVPHTELIAKKNWTSCLGCHDFHGNYHREVQKDLSETIETAKIMEYFSGQSASPYGLNKIHPAKQSPSKSQ